MIEVQPDTLMKRMALKLDLGFYRGVGTPPEPRGLKNIVGITNQTTGGNGAAPTLDLIATAVYQLYADDAVPTRS